MTSFRVYVQCDAEQFVIANTANVSCSVIELLCHWLVYLNKESQYFITWHCKAQNKYECRIVCLQIDTACHFSEKLLKQPLAIRFFSDTYFLGNLIYIHCV